MISANFVPDSISITSPVDWLVTLFRVSDGDQRADTRYLGIIDAFSGEIIIELLHESAKILPKTLASHAT